MMLGWQGRVVCGRRAVGNIVAIVHMLVDGILIVIFMYMLGIMNGQSGLKRQETENKGLNQ